MTEPCTGHEACQLRFAELERRLNALEPELRSAVQKLDTTLARLEGRLAGYVAAASALTGGLSFLAQFFLRR